MGHISFRAVTRDNLRELVRLKVAEGQDDYVASNLVSIAQAYVEPTWTPMGIYDGDTAVGFAMEGFDPDKNQWWIVRFMIGADHQGTGYGTTALAALVASMAERHGCREVYLSYVPGNDVAERMYAKAGFVPTGEVEEGEIVARRVLGDPSQP